MSIEAKFNVKIDKSICKGCERGIIACPKDLQKKDYVEGMHWLWKLLLFLYRT